MWSKRSRRRTRNGPAPVTDRFCTNSVRSQPLGQSAESSLERSANRSTYCAHFGLESSPIWIYIILSGLSEGFLAVTLGVSASRETGLHPNSVFSVRATQPLTCIFPVFNR